MKCPLLIANSVKDEVLGLGLFLLTECPWKLMENAFYFILKALVIPKIFSFLSWYFAFFHVEETVLLERLISKFMTSQPG